MSLQERKLKKYIIKQLRKDKKLKMYLININWIRIRKQKERRRRKTLIKFDDVMNDQRQVIFSQRLKILKEKDISDILKDFFDEVLVNLNLVRDNYQKSGDEKNYLTEIKNITGNVLSDIEIIKFGKLNEDEFNKKIQSLYSR